MEREVRYCTTEDGVRIAYSVEGEGPALLVLPFFIESFSLDHLFPEYRAFVKELAAGRKVVRFDPRGVGLSQREVTDLSADALIEDGRAVMDACGIQRYCLWASTTTGPFAITFALSHPERIEGLILYGTCASIGDAFPPAMLDVFAALSEANWPMACQTFADLTGRVGYPDAALRLGDWYRQSTTGSLGAQFIREASLLDCKDRLGRLSVRTMVLHRINDPTIPFALGQVLAREIPGARLVALEGFGNLPPFGDLPSITEAAKAFLDEVQGIRPAESAGSGVAAPGFRAVLFTDLVRHAEMMQRLGDERGRDVLREHEKITRDVLKQHGGTEVKTMGDGFMASFGSVTKAVECAIALQRAFAERNESTPEPLYVRVGLNAGEPIEEDGDLFGSTVILAARIAAAADGGEVLASMAVRELCSGKGFLFADRGEFVAKGFEEPVRVYQVSWRDTTAS